jgi:hypothetical protein
MTLNNVVQRIQQLSLGHNQVRKFYEGLVTDFLTDQKTKYPAVFLQSSGGNISLAGHATTLNYKMFFVDLVHVSEDTNANVRDVQSDMISVAMDILAQINNSNYTDWAPGSENNLQILVEEDNDLFAGCSIDISIRINYTQNICAIPTDITNYIPTDNTDMKLVYDLKYIATGAEGLTISIPAIVGKKILLITRENNQIYKVSSAPDSAEFIWNDTILVLGAITNPGERFLILYRNY